MNNLVAIFVVSLITEAVWESLKIIWQNGKVCIDRIGALIVGLIIAVGTGVDILTMVGIYAKIPYLGVILTGILMSRGSNFVHDILVKVSNPKAIAMELTKEIEEEIINKKNQR